MDFLHKGTADTMSETKGRFLSGKLLSQFHVHILMVSGDSQQYFSEDPERLLRVDSPSVNTFTFLWVWKL